MPEALIEAFEEGGREFAEWTPLLWDPIGAATVALKPPKPGERVLDVCCGAGSSAIPAARAVGPDGAVDAVDLATALLDQGRRRAADLPQLRFHRADATTWAPDGPPYDRVQSVFGVFFLPDMDEATARLARLLRPGGTLVVTTWRQAGYADVLEPFAQAFTERTGCRPTPTTSSVAAGRIDTVDKLTTWLDGLGLKDVEVHSVDHDAPVTPESGWNFLLGSAARTMLADLNPVTVTAVRDRFTELMADRPVFRARALVGMAGSAG